MSDDLFAGALGVESGTGYRVSRALASTFPDRAIIQISDPFDLEQFAHAGQCEAKQRSSPHAQVAFGWRRGHGLHSSVAIGIYDVRWNDATFVVAHGRWPQGYSTEDKWYVLAEDRAAGERFTEAVCAFCNEPRAAVLAFRGGCWNKDAEIYKAIEAASFDDLILAGNMAKDIREDFTSFLAARDEYAKYRVPWKRGVLFLGPPGNGKTHCLRATIKLLGVPCLYVQSLKSRYETDDANIARVFDRAREVTPCCLVFEDLDAMITDENRSSFLNQLDGFANASGMLTLATTNHPEKLDPAILDRPSRFDRKYHFDLPGKTERGRYIASWRERLAEEMRITDDETEKLIEETDSFSFAYLKELFLSSMIRWIRNREAGTMSAVLLTQLQMLREQMKTDASPTPDATVSEKRYPWD